MVIKQHRLTVLPNEKAETSVLVRPFVGVVSCCGQSWLFETCVCELVRFGLVWFGCKTGILDFKLGRDISSTFVLFFFSSQNRKTHRQPQIFLLLLLREEKCEDCAKLLTCTALVKCLP